MRALAAACLLALLAACVRGAYVNQQGPPGPGPQPGQGCSTLQDKHSCKKSKDGCVWCESSFASACYSEDQAKYLPPGFFACKPRPSHTDSGTSDAEVQITAAAAAHAALPEVGRKGGGGKGGGDQGGCRDLKDRKGCVKSKAVCSWCEGTYAPAMCIEEDQAEYLPPMVFDCEPSKRRKHHDDGDDDDDDVGPYPDPHGPSVVAAEGDAALALPEVVVDKKSKGRDDDKGKGCRDLKDRKHCVRSKDACSWCEGTYAPAMCLEEGQAKYLPASVYRCEGPRTEADAAIASKDGVEGEQQPNGDKQDADFDEDEDDDDLQDEDLGKKHKHDKQHHGKKHSHKKHHGKHSKDHHKHHGKKHHKKHHGKGKKADCRDLKDRKDCVKSKAVCSWCKGTYAPDMCIGEDQAKYIPPFVFDCEPSKRHKHHGDDEDAAGNDKEGEVPADAGNDDDDAEAGEDEEEAGLSKRHKHRKHRKHGEHGRHKRHSKHGKKRRHRDDDWECRDFTERRGCVRARAVCSWCEPSYFGSPVCVDQAKSKLFPPFTYTCEDSKRRRRDDEDDDDVEDADDATTEVEARGWSLTGLFDSVVDAIKHPFSADAEEEPEDLGGDVDAGPVEEDDVEEEEEEEEEEEGVPGVEAEGLAPPQPGPTDPCTQYDSEKKCGRRDGCAWCEGEWIEGQCFGQERAKKLPSSLFRCKLPSSEVAVS